MASSLLTQRNWLLTNIRKLADESKDENIKAKLEKLWERANNLDHDGVDDYSAFVDVVFDNQDKLEGLWREFEKLKGDYEELKGDYQEQSQKLQKVEEKLQKVEGDYQAQSQKLEMVGGDYKEQSQKLQKVEGDYQAQSQKLEKVEGDYQAQSHKLQKVEGDYQEQSQKLQKVVVQLQKREHGAVLRQVGINIEFELKVGYLQLCKDEDVTDLKIGYGKNKGKFKVWEIAKLSVGKAKELAQRSAQPEDLHSLETRWFGDDVNGPEKFRDAMSALKRFSFQGAHPTELDGILVDAGTARGLVRAMQMEESDDPELKRVALSYVDKLENIRQAQGGSQFLQSF